MGNDSALGHLVWFGVGVRVGGMCQSFLHLGGFSNLTHPRTQVHIRILWTLGSDDHILDSDTMMILYHDTNCLEAFNWSSLDISALHQYCVVWCVSFSANSQQPWGAVPRYWESVKWNVKQWDQEWKGLSPNLTTHNWAFFLKQAMYRHAQKRYPGISQIEYLEY